MTVDQTRHFNQYPITKLMFLGGLKDFSDFEKVMIIEYFHRSARLYEKSVSGNSQTSFPLKSLHRFRRKETQTFYVWEEMRHLHELKVRNLQSLGLAFWQIRFPVEISCKEILPCVVPPT